ncbi:hypothetical protein SAMN05421684_7904 [Asanoa ishikariensis]|uniref:Uncharacterized protein n=2 Tax=Asanoa ishikariensis TaxID=137265 RepID=A0A1H3URJ2_9ACTN|nr:hypothetical protein SAMN05421684_7904 [Asanoa ishikariensis]
MIASQHQHGPNGAIPTCPHESADEPAAAVIAITITITDKLACIAPYTGNEMGSGDAELADGTLRIDLLHTWRPVDKAVAACLIARIAYQGGAV